MAELLAKSSSSKNALPLIPVFKTGLVKVLFVNVCVAASNAKVSFASGTVKVLVVLPEIEAKSKARIFELSELFRILNPLSFVITAVEVIDANPVNVVALPPRAIPVLPIVSELLARLLLAIEDAVVRTVPVSAGKVIVTSAVDAGPFSVAEFVPLSVSSLKIMLPAEVEDPVRTGAVKLLFVKVSVPVVETNVAFETAVLN